MTTPRRDLLAYTPSELAELLVSYQQPAFRAKQIYRQLYVNLVDDIQQMTDLPLALRTELAQNHCIGSLTYVRTVSASFGPHTDDEWKFLAEIVVRRQPDGRYKMHYDPALAEPFKHQMPEGDLELWPLYDAIRSKMLVLRGELSDLLKRETCDAMTQRGPKAKIVEIPGVGHAPTLMHADQIAIVRDFLVG